MTRPKGLPLTGSIFHLSLPVHDLAETRRFYCSVLGAVEGRATTGWIDLFLFGSQLTFHQRPGEVAPVEAQGVRHFGAILAWHEWEALSRAIEASGHAFLMPPTLIGEGTPAEHAKLALRDPNGYMLEFKAYRELATVVPASMALPGL